MPNYDFRCKDCRKKFDVFMSYSDYGKTPVRCPHCGSEHVQRRIGRIRVTRSNDSRMENLADPSRLAGLDEDPRSLGRMMREMSSEVGEEMGPEFDEVVNRLEAGQSPDDIERDLPDLAEGMGSDEGPAGFDDF